MKYLRTTGIDITHTIRKLSTFQANFSSGLVEPPRRRSQWNWEPEMSLQFWCELSNDDADIAIIQGNTNLHTLSQISIDLIWIMWRYREIICNKRLINTETTDATWLIQVKSLSAISWISPKFAGRKWYNGYLTHQWWRFMLQGKNHTLVIWFIIFFKRLQKLLRWQQILDTDDERVLLLAVCVPRLI